ncbi:hypothetical protein CCACVL1_00835 [Corchorus capsularis]|uniref:Uncharacterized protein n=1 Tax=Corchorus capsularis TaxID=210143 RepID=A0A1R3KUA0_COCAP|nr:hypothetical protein CCACVL1_00835 [Corchorus capsularis]
MAMVVVTTGRTVETTTTSLFCYKS